MKTSIYFIVLWATVSLLLANSHSQAVHPYQPQFENTLKESWRWRLYKELEGFELRCLAEGADGTMWFGGKDGVRSYNGVHWKSFTVQDSLLGYPINAICASRDGSIYAGSGWGLSRFKNNTWEPIFPIESSIPWPIEKIIEASDGSLWIASAWGILHFDLENPILYTSSDMAVALKILAPSVKLSIVPDLCVPIRKWAASQAIGINVIEAGFISVYSGTYPRTIWQMAPNGPGQSMGLKIGDQILNYKHQTNHWLNTDGDKSDVEIKIKRPNSNATITIPRGQITGLYREFHAYDVYEDRQKNIWVGLAGGEILHYKPEQKKWSIYTNITTAKDTLKFGRHPRITQTNDQSIWVVSHDETVGIARLKAGQWEHYNLIEMWGRKDAEELHINTSILETRDHLLLIGGFGVLHTFENEKWAIYETHRTIPIPNTRLTDLLETKNKAVWIAGLNQEAIKFAYKNPQWTTYKDLNLHGQTSDGTRWFLWRERKVVRKQGESWHIFDITDGIIDTPTSLMVTNRDSIWIFGSHDGVAATAYFNGNKWQRKQYPKFSGSIEPRTVFESADGAIWFGATGNDVNSEIGQTGGIIRYQDGTSQHLRIDPDNSAYGIGQTANGVIWIGGYYGLKKFDGEAWAVADPTIWKGKQCDALYTDSQRNLWVATRSHGVFYHNGNHWENFTIENGLADNSIDNIIETNDGMIWVDTESGISRFNKLKNTWVTHSLFFNMNRDLPPIDSQNGFSKTPDGAIWLNIGREKKGISFKTISYLPDQIPPETKIINLPSARLPYGSAVTIEWTGEDAWHETLQNFILYSYRLDKDSWSPFSPQKIYTNLSLGSGTYSLEIKAMDTDFNESLTPAVANFVILPPIWKQPWFLSLITILLGIIVYQSIRVIKRGRALSLSNKALSEANNQLFETNQSLTSEISERERLDTQIQSLQYLYTLRAQLSETHTTEETLQTVGQAANELLGSTGGITITLDDQLYTFGHPTNTTQQYKRNLTWGERPRGTFVLYSTFILSESQERTLLDETVGQLTRVLESRELQMQLLQSSRLISLGQMAAGVAHELNQPLGGISATAEDYYLRLQDNMPISNDQLKDLFKRVLGMVDRMSNTVEHLRIFSRDTSQEPGKPLNINHVIHSSLDIIGTQLKNHGIEVTLELTEDLPQMTGHPYQLEQIFLNLLGNARDALDARTEPNATFKTIIISTKKDTDSIIAKVQDNGTGIAAQHLGQIFEPFYTTKPADKGTGLGLSITYAIVKNHGGNITCTSRQDHGTTFEVRFPTLTP